MTRPSEDGGWVESPTFDLLFLANLGWPLLLWPGLVTRAEGSPTDFWQLYFLTAPHRWLTLGLVALDPDRREGRGALFLTIALIAAAAVLGVWLASGDFLCLALVDYVWNGWHFAAQHAGVLRVYSRKVGGATPWLERHGLRLFLCYVIARTAGWSWGWMEAYPDALAALRLADLAVLLVPAALLSLALVRPTRASLGRLAYLASVCLLYAALLVALRQGDGDRVVALTAAAATFHAVEYLALVTHYARRRREVGSGGLFRQMAARWLTVLALYVLLLGLVGSGVSLWSPSLLTTWVGLNLWASFLHYAYDGMIWKLRRPATALALGAEPSSR